MRSAILIIVPMMVAACGASSAVGGGPPNAVGTIGPVIDCGDIGSGACDAAAHAALHVVAWRGQVQAVELGRGVLCPIADLLFEKTTCPGGPLGAPPGRTWIGHAVVTFVGQDRRAFLDVSLTGSAYMATLITFATPPEPPGSGT